jgi:hypothetical protein
VDQSRDRRGNRVRPRRLRLVVHQLALGSHLREHPREGVLPAARSHHRLGSWRHLLGRIEGDIHRVRDHGRPRRVLHLTRYEGVREAAEDLLLRWGARSPHRLRPASLPLEGGLRERVQLGSGRHVRREGGRIRGDAEGGELRRGEQSRQPRVRHHGDPHPDDRLLQSLVELGGRRSTARFAGLPTSARTSTRWQGHSW